MEYDLSLHGVTKRFGEFEAVKEVSFDLPKGHFYSILGPSGCGKTTMLRMIAGFIEPTEGDILIGGKAVNGVPPNKRPVSLVFQNLALFPMMSVGKNIAFGLERRGVARADIEKKVRNILETVGLPGYEDNQVTQLSGGQRQRVAIARCLVLEPTVLLLDEPLGALDLKLREQMKVELKKLQSQVGTTFLYITHDQSEALIMSDQIAVMNEGRLEQLDTPVNCYYNPASQFVAGFIGDSNRMQGKVLGVKGKDISLELTGGLKATGKAQGAFDQGASKEVQVFVRAEAFRPDPDGKLPNQLAGKVTSVMFDGNLMRLLVHPDGGMDELSVSLPLSGEYTKLQKGDHLKLGWEPAATLCFSGGA